MVLPPPLLARESIVVEREPEALIQLGSLDTLANRGGQDLLVRSLLVLAAMALGCGTLGCGTKAKTVPEPSQADAGVIDPCVRASELGVRYAGLLLGANICDTDRVEFSIFAPNAWQVAVQGDFGTHELRRDGAGVWSAIIGMESPGGKSYSFVIDGDEQVADPYAKAIPQHRGESIIVDPSFAWTDGAFIRPKRSDLIIYEMHVSDFTHDPSSELAEASRGTYLGAIEKIPHLQRLGVNAVELMPIAETQSNEYSWGYNPAFLFAPEAGYASTISGQQVAELQALIDALHEAGIAVIVDVVYNHMDGKEQDNPFWAVDPLYYFDFDEDGKVDRTPWGYKLATQRPMVQKLLYDNMKYWMDAFHVDGFRLDSTENMHFESVLSVTGALADAGYDDRFYIVEEFEAEHNEMLRVFNRERGKSLLSSWGTGYKNELWSVLANGSCDCESLGNATFFSNDEGWQGADEVIHYVSSHDEGTLRGRFGNNAESHRLAATHLLTALGIPMLWMGDEFGRLHYGNYHPEGRGLDREENRLDWSLATDNAEQLSFWTGLIQLRRNHQALRSNDGQYLQWNVVSWDGAIGYRYIGTPGDSDFVVLLNYTDTTQTYDVHFPRAEQWRVMSDGKHATHEPEGLKPYEVAQGSALIQVPARSSLILMSDHLNPAE